MSDEKLKTFKIGDTQRPTVGKTRAAGEKVSATQRDVAQSLGFKRIEGILERDEAAKISESLNTLIQQLEALNQNAGHPRDKASAHKAIVAVERSADLLDYLFQTKARMQKTP